MKWLGYIAGGLATVVYIGMIVAIHWKRGNDKFEKQLEDFIRKK